MSPLSRSDHTVLVVDDTDSKRYIISSWLRRAGHRVEEASTGGQALARCAQGGVDLVVLDVHLPDLSGTQVCQRLRAERATAAVPVLHISAIATEAADRSAGLDQGADAYLVDPIEPRELLSTVAALLRYYDARRSAEHLAERMARLLTATLRVNAAVGLPALLAAAAEGVVDILGAAAVVVAADDTGTWESAAAAPGEATTRTGRIAAGDVEALLADPSRAVAGASGGVSASGASGASWSLVPVRDRADQRVAVLAVELAAQPLAAQDLLVRQLGLVLAVALENRRAYDATRRVALELQRSLLPLAPPDVPGLAVAARYNASSEQAEIGGDFFDAFELADGTAVVAIGDVQGHSLQAATIMAGLRYSLRAYAHEGHVGASLVTRLNELLLREHPDHTATVVVLALDPARTSATVVNAGHVPPLLVTASGASFVEDCSPLLGVPAPEPEPVRVDLAPGDRLVLVTDGLVERRTTSIDDGLAALRREVLARGGDDVAALADALMRDLGAGSEDDTALVAVEVLA